MAAVHNFQPGDFLIFQLESGFAILRVLAVEDGIGEPTWHLAAYKEFFLAPENADASIDRPENLSIDRPHIALTNHAFESTQVARLKNVPLVESDLAGYRSWKDSDEKEVHDRSIRLLLGLRSTEARELDTNELKFAAHLAGDGRVLLRSSDQIRDRIGDGPVRNVLRNAVTILRENIRQIVAHPVKLRVENMRMIVLQPTLMHHLGE